MILLNNIGDLKIEFDHQDFKIGNYTVALESETEIGKASQMIFNSFESIFREELSNILSSKLAHAM